MGTTTKQKSVSPVKVAKRAPRVAATKIARKVSVGKAESVCVACQTSAPADKAFWVNNGPVVHTLDGLVEALKSMSDEQFEYHTKRVGNDFARWVDEVLCHGVCAKKLASAKSRTGAVRAITTCACG